MLAPRFPANTFTGILLIGAVVFGICTSIGGILADRYGRRQWLIGVTLAIMVFGLSISSFLSGATPLTVLAFIVVGLALMGFIVPWPLASSTSGPQTAMRRARDSMGQRYSSARLLTLGKAEWTYGFFEIRAQLPCGRGTWPAIWMLNSALVWPTGGELDIMEQVGSRPQRLFSTVHSAAGSGGHGVGAGTQIEDACQAMHDYQMLWTADEVSFAIDGRVHHRYRKQDHSGPAWPFDKPQFLILNIAIGGDLGGTVDDSIFPVQMRVAHVKVYQAGSR